jgi:hypothetical protein
VQAALQLLQIQSATTVLLLFFLVLHQLAVVVVVLSLVLQQVLLEVLAAAQKVTRQVQAERLLHLVKVLQAALVLAAEQQAVEVAQPQ